MSARSTKRRTVVVIMDMLVMGLLNDVVTRERLMTKKNPADDWDFPRFCYSLHFLTFNCTVHTVGMFLMASIYYVVPAIVICYATICVLGNVASLLEVFNL